MSDGITGTVSRSFLQQAWNAVPAALGTVGSFASLFGGRRRSAAGSFQGRMDNYGRQMQQTRQGFASEQDRGRTLSNYADPGYLQVLRQAQRQLSSDPETDTVRAARINQATAGIHDDYAAAQARASSALAARGLEASSLAAGTIAALENARAGSLGQARVQVGLDAERDRRQRLTQLLDILSGAAQFGAGRQTSALAQMGSLDRQGFNTYAQLYQQEREADDRDRQARSNWWLDAARTASLFR